MLQGVFGSQCMLKKHSRLYSGSFIESLQFFGAFLNHIEPEYFEIHLFLFTGVV